MPTDEPGALGGPDFLDAPFPYMRWAKAHLDGGPGNLGMSGVRPLAPEVRRELGLAVPLEVGAPEAGLKSALAERAGLDPERVFLAAGTSHANFAVFLALARGGHVACERPAYEALPALAGAVGARLDTFARDPERGWRIDPSSLAASVTPETDLVVVTDLHNPSGRRLEAEDLDLLVNAAEEADATVLVDEVYAGFDVPPRPTAALRHPRIVATNSLTKVHGLSDLRAGWVFASPDRIAAIDAWNNLVHPVLPPGPLADALAYLPHAEERLAALRGVFEARRAQVEAWVQRTPGVRWSTPHGGITGLVELTDGRDGDTVCRRAFEQHGVRGVPGSFF
jgi:hypothetical protein